MKLAIVTDGWRPQINGVVTTLSRTQESLQRAGHDVRVFGPDDLKQAALAALELDRARCRQARSSALESEHPARFFRTWCAPATADLWFQRRRLHPRRDLEARRGLELEHQR